MHMLYVKIVMVIVLVIQSVFTWAVLEHKQETYAISSPVSYIALLVSPLSVSPKIAKKTNPKTQKVGQRVHAVTTEKEGEREHSYRSPRSPN